MRLRHIAWLPVVLAVACRGPDVTSRSPITDDEVGKPDPRLAGVWQVFDDFTTKASTKPPVGLVHLTTAKGAQLAASWMAAGDLGPRVVWTGAVSGQVAERWYLSVQGRSGENAGRGVEDFYVFRCDFENGDVVRLRQLVKSRVKAAVERGELRGRAEGQDGFRVTSPTTELAAWVARQDPAEAFEPFILLRRVSLPAPFPASLDENRKSGE